MNILWNLEWGGTVREKKNYGHILHKTKIAIYTYWCFDNIFLYKVGSTLGGYVGGCLLIMSLPELTAENIGVIILFDQTPQSRCEIKVVVLRRGYHCEMCPVKGHHEAQHGLGLVVEGRGQLQDHTVLWVLQCKYFM